MLKLLRGAELIGTIDDVCYDWPWMIGRVVLTEAASKYKEAFDQMRHSQPVNAGSDLDVNVLEDWYTETENGNREGIRFPGIYDGGEIRWRTQPKH